MANDREVTVKDYTPQNSRTIFKTDSIVDSVIDSFVDRANVGKAKYGTDMDRTDLSLEEWIEHALQEHMDAILYLTKIKKIIGGNKS
jgi:hypothetical protein